MYAFPGQRVKVFSFEVKQIILNLTTEICMRSSGARASAVQAAPPGSDRPVNSMVTGVPGIEPMERQLGQRFRGNWVAC